MYIRIIFLCTYIHIRILCLCTNIVHKKLYAGQQKIGLLDKKKEHKIAFSDWAID